MRHEARDLPGGHETLRPPAGAAALVAAVVGPPRRGGRQSLNVVKPQVSRLRSLVTPCVPRTISKNRISRLKPAGKWGILISVKPARAGTCQMSMPE